MKQQTSAATETGNKGKKQHYEGRIIYAGQTHLNFLKNRMS